MVKKALANIAGAIIGLYICSVVIIVPYYNWQYAKNSGFLSWMFFGEVVATAQSVIWPYYAFFSEEKPEEIAKAKMPHFVKSKKVHDRAMAIIEDAGGIHKLSSNDKETVSELLEYAAAEAKDVSPDLLRKLHPDLPEVYQTDYIQATEALLYGLYNDDNASIAQAGLKFMKLSQWMNDHATEIDFNFLSDHE